MHELMAADLRRSRLHLFWIKLLFTAAVAGLWVAESELAPDVAADAVDRFALGSAPYFFVGMEVTTLVLAVAVWFVPICSLVWMVPVAWLVPLGASELPTAWRVLALVSLLALAWLGLRARRAAPDGPRRQPPIQDFEETWAFQPALPGWLAVAAGVVLAAGLLVIHQVVLTQVMDFEERAENTLAEVISYDDEHLEVLVRVGEEEMALEEPYWEEQPRVGDRVPVLVDPDDPEHVVFLAGLEDPSWWAGLAVVAPLAGLWWGVPIIRRSQGSRAIVARGAPATMVRLASLGEGTFQLLPLDANTPLVHVVKFAGLVPGSDVAAFMHGWDGELDDDGEASVDDEPESLPESDAELAIWADEVKDLWHSMDDDDPGTPPFSDMAEDEKVMVEADFGPDVFGAEPFALLGSWAHGSTVVLLRGSGQGWVAEIKEPHFQSGSHSKLPWLRSVPERVPWEMQETVPADRPRGRIEEVRQAAGAWARRHTPWLRWIVSLGAAAIGVFLVPLVVWDIAEDGFGVFRVIRLALFILSAVAAPTLAVLGVCSMGTGRSRWGLMSYGVLVDEVIAPHRLVSVIPGRDALALRLRDPEDALMVMPEDVGDGLEPYGAACEVEKWFSSAPADGRSRRLPAPNLIATLLMVLASAVACVVLLI